MLSQDDAQWIAGVAEHEAEQAERDVVIVDHRNWLAFRIFVELATNWRVIPTFGTPPYITQGLDYAAVAAVLSLYGLTPGKRRDTFFRIRQMERGALAAMRNIPFADLLPEAG